ncbi:hypothetical protein A2801_02800 [Candidatus Woesebacteria bacterium RIFCSPHIGHO2_01_FULL_41_10]|uniref:Type II secretion system protein GspH n=1 Tax=Candidatus Woesebacteria bacterium RIFCSPHIGHO2_01_FULL_41_10 TaxID=1802500 RepID=A0A1F7YQP1_9BACT|nr:MAG: hypothetical protein A2801_02800 [Candidatus Woesebacteria bacterium RIFCSPHIGHO2_01_FULL_41_10]
MKKNSTSQKAGYSLIEILVVIAVFSIVAVIATQSTILSLGGARRTDSSTKVRENLNFALSIVERQVRNAREITSVCDGSSLSTLSYIDYNRIPTNFSCQSAGAGRYYVASGSSSVRLTGQDVFLTNCEFICTVGGANLPPDITINFTGQDALQTGPDAAQITIGTTIRLRVY